VWGAAGVNCVRMDADRELDVWLENYLGQHGATSGTFIGFGTAGYAWRP